MRNLGQSLEFNFQEWIRIARRKSKENLLWSLFLMTVVATIFGALYEVQMMHSLYHFKAQEVNNPMLQTVRNSEWVETKKLKPLQANHSELKEAFCKSVAKSPFCCEVISQPFLYVCEISQTSFSLAKWSLVHPDICYRHWEIFFIRFFLSKSQFSL